MIIHKGNENLQLIRPVVTMGIFDGVHRGHRTLLDSLVSCARKEGGEAVVVTFEPHPRIVLSGSDEGFAVLTTIDEKIRLLDHAQVDHLIIMEFTRSLSNTEADDFVREILVKKLGTRHLIVGYDHHFGKSRMGDYETMHECGRKYGFIVEKVSEVSSSDGVISSTSVREALKAGETEAANRWLGYNYSVTGTVVAGRNLGRSLGFPTANIRPSDRYKLIPANGVYAVEVQIGDSYYPGMLNIGFNPTVDTENQNRSVEVNIFNFNKDIYGRQIRVIFRYRLRDEIRFDDISQLIKQMELDKEQVLKLLK